MDLQLLALLLVVVVLLVWRAATRERREYAQFKRLRATEARQKVLRKWLIESVLVMGGLAAAVLLAAWELVPRVLADVQAWPPIAGARHAFVESDFGPGLAVGLGIGLLAALLVPILLMSRQQESNIPALGDVGALLPRTRAELPYGAGLSISAGVFEELLFRLGMPALLFGIIPNGPLAFLIATLVFGALHLYQKLTGVITATVLGIIFASVYVVSGSIVLVIVLHAIIDLRALVLLPLVVGKVWSKTA
ncbi:CPBP family intramembrane glutamic endopeptidase [Protaetiibacter larvae]|uniref:CPBP family intramembrane metalloprotease n=1 Tax=Protaetiibacter larvae TaxID=2592654 RepID=A0A5C1Y6L5_9MICO|nr:CPBP family intramembrane glutamic endopeptidase [Protaetiibacter larvae]QEO09544.1 CPBP family intramembrane metalloprotease [Protaetiibacter larvae]